MPDYSSPFSFFPNLSVAMIDRQFLDVGEKATSSILIKHFADVLNIISLVVDRCPGSISFLCFL